MRKAWSIIAFLFVFTLTGMAQEETPLRIGLQVSPTFSFMSSDENSINNNGTNLGLKLQLIVEKYFQENYAFTSGIGFAFNSGGTLQYDEGGALWRNSVETTSDEFPEGVDLKFDINYIEIPFGIKLRTREFGYFRYYGEPHLILSFRSQARGTAKGNEDLEKINIKKDVNLLGLAWGIGGGTEYSVSESTSLVAGLYYQSLFTDVTDDKGGDDSKGVVSTITIRLGVLF